ncbi:MAG TPA: four-carbon acid sugar kinase family protein [Candidatus Limnocylindrales bacterium]
MPEPSARDPRDGLPPPWPLDELATIRRLARGRTLVVLDDDPTGTQTVRDVPVLTLPGIGELGRLLAARVPALFILTNSRSLPARAAEALARRLGRTIATESNRTGRRVSVVSRSDSTLRGHFPGEVDALAHGFGLQGARTVLAPYFGDGGRITIDDVHYLVRNGHTVPVAETEFARDAAFGYSASNLRAWIAMRGGGQAGIVSLSLDAIRAGGPDEVARILAAAPQGSVCIANAAADGDIEVVAAGVLRAERRGVPLIVRTAASYVRAAAGQPHHPLLVAAEIPVGRGPGLVVVGSHVAGTTRQLDALLADAPCPVELIELDADVAANARRAGRLGRDAAARAGTALARGRTPILATSRTPLGGDSSDAEDAGVRRSARISATLVSVVRSLERRPAWVIAKGGITSSDVATMGLGIRVARVLGQVVPGVPVWRSGRGSRWPGLSLVVFPGNVGGDEDLRLVAATLVESGRPLGDPRT